VNNTEPETQDESSDDDEYYYYYYEESDDHRRAVVQLTNIYYPLEVSVSHNQFSNPDAAQELSVDLRVLPPTFILELGLNFWNRSNYSAVIQRYVCQKLTVA